MIYQTEETRQKILRAAEAQFLERGFFHTQMKDVAEAVGISRNTLYRYFRDKGDLGFATLDAVVNRILASFHDTLERAAAMEHANAHQKLVAALSELALGDRHDTEFRFLAEFDAYYSGDRLPEDFAGRQDLSQWTPVGQDLEELVREGVADGSIRDDIDAPLLLWLLLNTVRLLRREIVTRGAALALPREEDVERLLPALMTLLSDGLRPAD